MPPEKRQLLDWDTRYRIIYGTARGLLYLHEDSQIKILHRDLKGSNVLLDADMNPKITNQVVGTLGYMAPEYAVPGHLLVKLDTCFESEADESGTLLSYVSRPNQFRNRGTNFVLLITSTDWTRFCRFDPGKLDQG